MAYTDKQGERRASPLLLGRLQLDQRRVAATAQPADLVAFWQTMAVGGAVLLVGGASWYWRRRSRRSKADDDAGKHVETETWLQTVQTDSAPSQPMNGRFKNPSSSLSALFDAGHEPDDDESE
jgi:hypothetical protein